MNPLWTLSENVCLSVIPMQILLSTNFLLSKIKQTLFLNIIIFENQKVSGIQFHIKCFFCVQFNKKKKIFSQLLMWY